MILRKPYGFLIKHFRLIHLVLTAMYILLAIKVNSLLKYYNDFIAGSESKLNAINHVTNYYLIAIIASIIICLIIYALMRYKKKPKLLYLILIALYLVVAVIINISYDGLNEIYIATLDAKTQRLNRDLLRIIIIFQYISICFTLIRGLGFDIKKFNFKEDIAELELDITDAEEIELTIGHTEGIQRKIRRNIRELKYYYKENKLFINVIIIIVIVILASTITINKEVINKVYNENEQVSTDNYNFTVLNTYITNKSYSGEVITSTDTSFLIAKISIASKITASELNTSNIILKANNNTYTINQKYYNNFIDLGTSYRGQNIASSTTYIFIFNIKNEDINNNMQIIYAGDKKINIKPVNLDEVNEEKKYKLTETIDLSNSPLESGNITISSYEIKNKFEYSYNYEVSGKTYTSKINITSTSKTIMNLKLTYQIPDKFTIYEFLTNYAKLKYKVGDQEYTNTMLSNKTPGSYNEGLYLEVDKEIENASNIWLEFTIRNKKYIYNLK